MIRPIEADRFREVIYIPNHANGDREHPDCKRGKLCRFDPALVGIPDATLFVKFETNETPKGCYAHNLVWATEVYTITVTKEDYINAECYGVHTCVMALAIQRGTGDKGWEVSEEEVYHKERDVWVSAPVWLSEIVEAADGCLNKDPNDPFSGQYTGPTLTTSELWALAQQFQTPTFTINIKTGEIGVPAYGEPISQIDLFPEREKAGLKEVSFETRSLKYHNPYMG